MLVLMRNEFPAIAKTEREDAADVQAQETCNNQAQVGTQMRKEVVWLAQSGQRVSLLLEGSEAQ